MARKMFGKRGGGRRKRLLIVSAFALLALTLLLTVAASGASLTNSNFEIDTDANLVVNGGASALDWANVTQDRKGDNASGSGDNSMGGGTKEDTEVPSITTGGIPPNKSDLKDFGVFSEENANGKFMHLYWTRVQDPSGTTLMDFEFNQSKTLSSNNVTPVRTKGDLLLTYELSNGGTNPQLFKHTWRTAAADGTCEASNSYPCWGGRTALTGNAIGSINTTAITAANADGLGALSARTFGEASINLASVFDAAKCASFGSAYLKSRSSDSFTAAMKDFIAPLAVNISNCGSVIIRKQTSPADATTDFDFSSTVTTDPADATASAFKLKDDGVKTINNAVAGTGKVVTETVTAGYVLSEIDCSASTAGSNYTANITDGTVGGVPPHSVQFDVVVGKTIDCTFTNTKKPQIRLVKALDPAADTGKFNLDITQGTTSKASATDVGNNGSAPASGFVTVDAGSVTVSETAGTGTSLADYASSIDCGSGSTNVTSRTITVADGDVITCTVTNVRKPQIRLVKVLDPAADTGKFNLDITQGTTSKASATDVGNNGSAPASGFVTVDAGSVTVSETAGTGTSLADYASSIDCGSGSTNVTSRTITVANKDVITCIVTNVRKPQIRLVKALDPAADTGKFNLDITQGTTSKASATDVGNNGSAPASGYVTVDAGSVTVSETAGTGTVLADYVSSIDCGSGSAAGTSRTITVANKDVITCTITNKRRTFAIVAYVCETTSGTPALYKSTVTLPNPGGVAKTTQTSVPAGTDAATLCGLAANYGGLNTGDHLAKVSIGTAPAP